MFSLFQTAAGFDLPLVTALTAFIALPVKVLVDVVKGAVPKLPGTLLPLAGLLIGYLFSVVVLVAVEVPFKASVWAQCAIAAVGAQVGAMAVTALQNKVNRTEERMDAALAAPAGTTKAEVDAQVFKGEGK
jgi:hypothetical protein